MPFLILLCFTGGAFLTHNRCLINEWVFQWENDTFNSFKLEPKWFMFYIFHLKDLSSQRWQLFFNLTQKIGRVWDKHLYSKILKFKEHSSKVLRLFFTGFLEIILYSGYRNCGSWTISIGLTWECIRNPGSWGSPQNQNL